MMAQVPLYKVYMSDKVDAQLSKTLHSGYIGQGPVVEEFEQELAQYLGTQHLLTTNSCTSALQLALHLVDHNVQNQEVITTPISCFATAASIRHCSMILRWADIDPATGNMNLESIKKSLSLHTVAVLPVHFCGYPQDMNLLYDLLRWWHDQTGKKVYVIEDCAHALGSVYRGQKIGSHPYELSIKCFSFQAVKTLTTGDGGAIILPNETLYQRARLLRWYGLDRTKDRYSQDIREIGHKFNMNDIDATIGRVNLAEVDSLIQTQRDNRAYYQSALSDVFDVELFDADSEDCYSACPVFPLKVDGKNTFEAKLKHRGVEAVTPHGRCDRHRSMMNYRCKLPEMDELEPELTAIPAGWWVTPQDRESIASYIREGW